MTTTETNRFGEMQTKWQSHKHPDNAEFMQVVMYMHIQFPDGRNHLYWSLQGSSAHDKHMIANIPLEEALRLYADAPVEAISEEMLEAYRQNKP